MPGLTRRQLLIGAGAATASIVAGGAAAVAVLRDGDRRGPLRAPPSGATMVSGNLSSAHMGRSVGWSIATPARPVEATVYCLHGKGGDHRFAFDDIGVGDVVESLRAPLVLASVDGGPDSYWHQRADGTDAMAMLLDEFIPFVEMQAQTSRRALLGWSMGGYGSLLAAERATKPFFAIAAASPALWTSAGQTAPGAFDNAADYHRFDVFRDEQRLAGTVVRIDCATSDPFYQATRRFVAGLPPGAQATFGPGSHDATYWRRVAPAQIASIARALAPA